jgi:endonuclease YncB( thermonuclease family)
MKPLLIISFIFLSSCYCKKHVVYIIDGDTLIMQDRTKVRLTGIDAPEKNQEGGQEAKQYLSSLVLNKTITLIKVDKDKYGRKVCKVYCNGSYINELMVISGRAWAYKRFSSTRLHNAELEARIKRIGIWSKNNVLQPYLFRKLYSSK